ncbi:Hypothetical protein FKW44_014008, partial [Caligus rogercresseyi]
MEIANEAMGKGNDGVLLFLEGCISVSLDSISPSNRSPYQNNHYFSDMANRVENGNHNPSTAKGQTT